MTRHIRYDVAGRTAWVTIDRPERKNALRLAEFAALGDCFERFEADAGASVLVLTGAGDSFSSGADLSDLEPYRSDLAAHLRALHRAAAALAAVTKPTIAAINGIAVGAGLNLALGCDLTIAAESAMVSEIFIDRGLTLDFGGSALLLQRIGLHKAKELAFFGTRLKGRELAESGLVNLVVPDSDLRNVAGEWARSLSERSPEALRSLKELLNAASQPVAPAIEREIAAQAEVAARALNSPETARYRHG